MTIETVREFLCISKVSPQVQKLSGWGGKKKGELGLDYLYRISMLPDWRDQEDLAKAIFERDLSLIEVRDIVQMKSRNPTKLMAECISDVMKLRPIIEKKVIVVTRVEEVTLKTLINRANSLKTSPDEYIKTILSEILHGNVFAVRFRDNLVVITLNEEGYEELKSVALF